MHPRDAHKKVMKMIIKWLRNQGKTIEETTPAIKKNDKIDFVMNGHTVKFKYCQKDYSNILFEILNDRRAGWFRATKAELFLYYMEDSNRLYTIDIEKTRKYIKENNIRKTSKGSFDGGICYMIPIRTLDEENLIKERLFVA